MSLEGAVNLRQMSMSAALCAACCLSEQRVDILTSSSRQSNPIRHHNWYGAAPWRFKKACSLKGRPERHFRYWIWKRSSDPSHRIEQLQHWESSSTDAIIFGDPSQQCKTVGFIVNFSSGNLLQLLKLGKRALSLSISIQIVQEDNSCLDGTYCISTEDKTMSLALSISRLLPDHYN